MLRDPRRGMDCFMSHIHSYTFDLEPNSVPPDSGECSSVLVGSLPVSCDAAIDATLCSVSLPEGLLARLSVLVAVMPEEVADQADWLGC